VITAPSVGVFWRAPEPGAPAFVEVGSRVEVGDTLGIVEVMKLMSNVAADVAGEVVAIHAENASTVQFGTPLVTIRVGTAG
jgi:biotin carboxyl carrier protein